MQRTHQVRPSITPPSEAAPPGRGERLDPALRSALEPRFGFDFSAVRVHSDPAAAEATHAAQATAFAHGNDLYFQSGAYQPETPSGQTLIAHELSHVVQWQNAGKPNPARAFSHSSDPAEREAQGAADRVTRGQSVSLSAAPSAAIAREEEGEHHHKGGWLDHLFGLNPDRSFVEAGLNPLIGPEGALNIHEGDGDGMKLLRAAGIVGALPYIGTAAIGGHALDEINHGPSLLHGAFDW